LNAEARPVALVLQRLHCFSSRQILSVQLKVALLTDGIHPFVIGGMQRHSYNLCKYLAAAGIQVDLYHTCPSPVQRSIEYREFFTETEIARINFILVEWPESGGYPGHYLRESYIFSKCLFERMVALDPPDLIYAKGYTAWYLLKKGFNAPIVVNFHGVEFLQPGFSLAERLSQLILRYPALRQMKMADRVISYGGGITRILAKHIARHKIVEIPAAIAASWLNNSTLQQREVVRFCFVGREERRKAIPELHAVIRELLPEFDFEFHFVGEMRQTRKIESPKIFYHGLITDSENLSRFLRGMDVLVCPSYAEGMPNVILEAMASGCAVIAADVGAIATVVSEDSGWLFKRGDFQAMKYIMIDIITQERIHLLAKRRNAIATVSKDFIWERVIAVTLEKLGPLAVSA
jgi:glycosyltransferase involved in cell wall biosynthesis